MKVNWLLDEQILESRATTGNMKQSILDAGHNLYTTKYVPLSYEQDYGPGGWENKPTIIYGTIGYVNKCRIPFIPGAYGINQNTDCNFYYPELPSNWMLNSGFIMVPFGVIKNDHSRFFDLFETNCLFIRPNSGQKTFTGTTINRYNAEDELSASMQLTSVMNDTICLVSPALDIKGEFRFVIGNKEVIDGSEYRWDNILDIRHDYPDDCLKLAKEMARFPWQPDICYTVDIADTPNGPKIVELNGFSCAGLYACDKDLIVNRISEIAFRDFRGEL